MDDNKLDIEVIKGDGQDLNISDVYEHIKKNSNETDPKSDKEVVVPRSSDKKENKED